MRLNDKAKSSMQGVSADLPLDAPGAEALNLARGGTS